MEVIHLSILDISRRKSKVVGPLPPQDLIVYLGVEVTYLGEQVVCGLS